MRQNKSNRKITANHCIILLSIIGLTVCVAVLFPQVRQMIMNLAERIAHREASTYQSWLKVLLSYAMGGICFILFFDYCTLTDSGRIFVRKVKQEIKECWSEIDFRSFIKPVLLLSGVYLLGIVTIVRANFLYLDDLGRTVVGYRGWYNWSRYVSEFSSIFVHGNTNLTDISPVPQLLAVLILSISSVLLVYVIGNKKITTVRLLASVPLGLSPFFLECLSFKYDAPYMALSILTCIIPFLFIARNKAFFFCSVLSMLMMCTTYQAVSGIYLIIALILCFRDWNSHEKPDKEILSFLGMAVSAFCLSMILFKFFLLKPSDEYSSTAMHPLPRLISGSLNNIKDYAITINQDLGMIWKIGIGLVLLFYIIQSIQASERKKVVSLFVSILILSMSFVLSYGVYSLLAKPLYLPRALIGFGVFLSILCVYTVSNYKKIATITVLALNWCLFTFAFSYGNALADQARYAEFRIEILLNDLNTLYPDRNREDMMIQLKNSIDFAPSVKNIAKHYPVIEQLVPKRLAEGYCWEVFYFMEYFNYSIYGLTDPSGEEYNNYSDLNLPVVLDSYYHTIQSNGEYVLITLKH